MNGVNQSRLAIPAQCGEQVAMRGQPQWNKYPTISQDIFFLTCIKTVIMSAPKGPFRLVTVNTAPERAQRLIGRVAVALKDRYEIIHVDNCACGFMTCNYLNCSIFM